MGKNYCPTSLAGNLTKNCTDGLVMGVEKIGKLINWDDVDIEATKASFVTDSKNTYASLVIKKGKKAYRMGNISNLTTTKVDGAYSSKFQHVISGAILDDGDDVGAIVEALGSNEGKFIAVVEHKFKDFGRSSRPGSSSFQIIGLDVPLTSNGQTIANDKNSADTDGGWAFALACSDNAARTLWYSTSYAATKALFDALETIVE